MTTSPRNFHPAAATDEALRAACTIRSQRRSGPGGQHRNKVATAVFLTHSATGITASASERRSQAENLKRAFRRLRMNLAVQIRTPWQRPSHLWQARCRSRRIVVNAHHADFPVLIAEALDALNSVHWDVRAAAERLSCTPTQLVRFLQNEPSVGELLKKKRSEGGSRDSNGLDRPGTRS